MIISTSSFTSNTHLLRHHATSSVEYRLGLNLQQDLLLLLFRAARAIKAGHGPAETLIRGQKSTDLCKEQEPIIRGGSCLSTR